MDKISFYAVGKRKTSIAKVACFIGSGKIIINNKQDIDFFNCFSGELQSFKAPLILLNLLNCYDFSICVKGGGLISQLDAIRLGISRVILQIDKNHRAILKKEGFLTRDSRIKERRKYGLKKARKASQYSKR